VEKDTKKYRWKAREKRKIEMEHDDERKFIHISSARRTLVMAGRTTSCTYINNPEVYFLPDSKLFGCPIG